MATPWISVVSVVKDDPDGFERTLISIMNQNLDDVQLVVIDSSGDPDVIPSLISSFPGEVIYYWVPPAGVYSAMNKALTHASGNFTYFANAGDEFFSSHVLSDVRSLAKDSVWAFGPVEIVEADGSRVFTPAWNYKAEQARGFSRGFFPAHQGTFVRTDQLRALGGFDTSYSVAADYAMALRLSLLADPVILPFVIARFHEGGLSTKQWKESFREFHRARQEILNPRGSARIKEEFDTRLHFAAVWLTREVRSRL
jgi:GT2 family glycosyltransferase